MSGLLNFLQGASNAAASNVSAPVDGLAWLLKKAGVKVGTPIGGSDWMRSKGLTADAPGLGGLLGESVGGVLPMIAAAKAPQIASGLLRVGENAAAKSMITGPSAGQRGMIVLPEDAGKSLIDYGIDHRPMTDAQGAARLHDLTPAFGEDIYGKNALQFFGSGDTRERGIVKTLTALRGKPDAQVTIYRGVPKGINKINPGDWVTLDPKAAAEYGEVISMKVPASDVTSSADSLMEFGYHPQPK